MNDDQVSIIKLRYLDVAYGSRSKIAQFTLSEVF